ncbi:hypothetical protein [Streptomyces europaeiscabiei]|uniref:hypothetical protein n=1 Tax=Streptomyces europaeiscabiei TaxID=146819 RepID=UPI0029B5FAF1|nr:hypothetical protein [Streptomyces europaeiscabiei]MDX3672687.1 hypothetical protein [Streptomyces europaeiscabiei]
MPCSRLTRHQRPCRLDAAEWPAFDGMPAPVAACWTHLTAVEREQCKAARVRRNKEHQERCLQRQAELAARGVVKPQPVAVYEERRCNGQCITRADLVDRQHPGMHHDHSDSAISACANCDDVICILCRDRNHSMDTPCTSPSALVGYEVAVAEGEEIDHGPDPHGYLNTLVVRLARATGERHAVINARINRAVGVSSRVGAEEAVIRRAAAVARDWLTAEEQGAPSSRA